LQPEQRISLAPKITDNNGTQHWRSHYTVVLCDTKLVATNFSLQPADDIKQLPVRFNDFWDHADALHWNTATGVNKDSIGASGTITLGPVATRFAAGPHHICFGAQLSPRAGSRWRVGSLDLVPDASATPANYTADNGVIGASFRGVGRSESAMPEQLLP